MSAALARAFGGAVMEASIRNSPEDFQVEEIPSFEAEGQGEHLLLTVEKTGINTAAAARLIAGWASLPDMAIGYAGMKDRHAVTRQRFSVHLPKRVSPPLELLQSESLRVLDATWHNRKLPRGALAGNRFVLLLREVTGEPAVIDARLQKISERGIPNWVGEQRFGRDGNNVRAALDMFAGRRVKRDQRSILLSAARSQLFNQVLAVRVLQATWDHGLDGEVWALSGSRSVFGPEPWSEVLAQRVEAFDIHPSGPLWGQGELRTIGECERMERETLADEEASALRQGLESAGLSQERRALRLRVEGLQWEWLEPQVLRLRFALPPGSYATAVLHELGTATDRARS